MTSGGGTVRAGKRARLIGVVVAVAAVAALVLTPQPAVPWVQGARYLLLTVVSLAALALAAGVSRRRAPAQAAEPLETLQVDAPHARTLVRAADIEWIEAAGNYVRLHLAGSDVLHRVSLARLERSLGRDFVRVHRSAIVRMDAVRRVAPLPSGDAVLHLDSGAEVRLSRRYARAFDERTGRKR